MLKKEMPNGIILYEGPSRIDRTPIVAILTGFKKGSNEKTGDMLQVWIIKKDLHPCNTKKEGKDVSVCGNCKHRFFGSCYVELRRGPIKTYNSYKNGSYVKMKHKYKELFKGKSIRWGAYGDPCAIPLRIIKKYSALVDGITGYTHQWNKKRNDGYKKYLMASVDSTLVYYKEYYQAQKRGWRTFRTTTRYDFMVFDNEFRCPASAEMGKLTTCENCNSCNGLSSNYARNNPVIFIHGTEWKIEHFEMGMEAIKNKQKYRKNWNKSGKSRKKVGKKSGKSLIQVG